MRKTLTQLVLMQHENVSISLRRCKFGQRNFNIHAWMYVKDEAKGA